ncbi:MAG: polyprenyl synthetase family protein [Solirubrobacteraceae bacterium]
MAPAYPDHLRAQIEAHLSSIRFSNEYSTAGLEEAMRYSLLAGGKRIRPVLSLATAGALGAEPAQVLALAAAVELIHTYSLIHDDLPAMDDDDLRRGRLSCHKAFGEDVAILAGDALYAEAFRLLLSEQRGEPPRVLAAAAELAAATGVKGMVGGQYIDVAGTAPQDAAGLRRLHELKTGRLIGASVRCAELLCGPAAVVGRSALEPFARELGVLFQIVDDILDVTGSAQELGKVQGADERLGKRTYVTEFGLDGARELAGESRARAHGALEAAFGAGGQLQGDPSELAQIADFIAIRSF